MAARQAAAEGFDWPDIDGVFAKLFEELAELRAASSPAERGEELGDLLFVLANLARRMEVDAEAALAQAMAKFERRYGAVMTDAASLPPPGHPERLDAMEARWQAAKRRERS